MEMEPLLAMLVDATEYDNVVVPLPEPAAPDSTVIHEELLDALQLPTHPLGDETTAMLPVPPEAVAVALDGDSVIPHAGCGAPNVQVSVMTTRS
jgi:hypothetical protein